ncbi:MAG: hypothetical protein IPK16_01955 [Anaerolineales bacterium]|nr:hypothetical protein [Anaerolineales bacterium]
MGAPTATTTPTPTVAPPTNTPTNTPTSTPTSTPFVAPDFKLPGTQPGALIDAIADPTACSSCHTDPIYQTWRGSMMSQAGRDPLFWAALHVAEQDAPGSGDYCLRCHTPKGWFEGRSHPTDGSALNAVDIQSGISCAFCHRMVAPKPSQTDEAANYDAAVRAALAATPPPDQPGSAMIILDPEDNRRGPFALDAAPPHPKATWRTDFLGQAADAVTESSMCGSCHTLDNPTLSWDAARDQYWPNSANQPPPSVAQDALFPIERTYDEWLASTYAKQGVYAPLFAGSKPDGIVRSCQDCHMPRATGDAALFGGATRDCVTNGCLPVHELVGGNTWAPQLLKDARWRLNAQADSGALDETTLAARAMLQRAATLTATLANAGGVKSVAVRITNETGHKLPTGYAEGRRMWLMLEAFDAAGTRLYVSGAYDPATGILTEDPALTVYEVKQGLRLNWRLCSANRPANRSTLS